MKNATEELFGERLKQARSMSGLSLRKLSEAIGGAVSYNALAKYENGEMMPNSEVLMAVAEATGQSYGFFFREKKAEIKELKFRSATTAAGKKIAGVIQEKALDFFERYFEIEAILGVNSKFKNPLGLRGIRTPGDVENAADKIRSSWKLGMNALANIHDVLEENHVKVFEVNTPESLDGFCGWLDGQPIVGVANWLNDQCLTRKRHTLLHELGHILFKDRLPEDISEKEEEKLMSRFAGALVFPATSFYEEFGKNRTSISITELIDAKVKYGISISSIIMRAFELNCISEAFYKRFWKNYKEQNWKDGEPGDKDYRGDETSTRFKQYVYRALSEENITRSKAAELLNVSLDSIRDGFVVFK